VAAVDCIMKIKSVISSLVRLAAGVSLVFTSCNLNAATSNGERETNLVCEVTETFVGSSGAEYNKSGKLVLTVRELLALRSVVFEGKSMFGGSDWAVANQSMEGYEAVDRSTRDAWEFAAHSKRTRIRYEVFLDRTNGMFSLVARGNDPDVLTKVYGECRKRTARENIF